MTPEEILIAKEKINNVITNFDVETFKRLHRKTFYALITLETKFKEKFPKECEEYLIELYEEK